RTLASALRVEPLQLALGLADCREEVAQRVDFEIGLCALGAVGRIAELSARTAYPHALEAETAGGHDVGAPALGDREGPALGDPQGGEFGERDAEMRPVRLVGADPLRGHHDIERRAQFLARDLERRVVDVAQRAELEAPRLERLEDRGTVREGIPGARAL